MWYAYGWGTVGAAGIININRTSIRTGPTMFGYFPVNNKELNPVKIRAFCSKIL